MLDINNRMELTSTQKRTLIGAFNLFTLGDRDVKVDPSRGGYSKVVYTARDSRLGAACTLTVERRFDGNSTMDFDTHYLLKIAKDGAMPIQTLAVRDNGIFGSEHGPVKYFKALEAIAKLP